MGHVDNFALLLKSLKEKQRLQLLCSQRHRKEILHLKKNKKKMNLYFFHFNLWKLGKSALCNKRHTNTILGPGATVVSTACTLSTFNVALKE